MSGSSIGIASAILILALSAFLPALAVHPDDQGLAKPHYYEWAGRNLKENWNYLFRPGMVNQCTPRGLKADYTLVESSRKAFTRDDPLLGRYCGSPFSAGEF